MLVLPQKVIKMLHFKAFWHKKTLKKSGFQT